MFLLFPKKSEFVGGPFSAYVSFIISQKSFVEVFVGA